MNYDPIKRSLGKVFNQSPFLRKLFYHLLDWLLLRTWHVKKEIRLWVKETGEKKDVCLLDAGSGFGQYSYFLSGLNKNWKVKGVDVKPNKLKTVTSSSGVLDVAMPLLPMPILLSSAKPPFTISYSR